MGGGTKEVPRETQGLHHLSEVRDPKKLGVKGSSRVPWHPLPILDAPRLRPGLGRPTA